MYKFLKFKEGFTLENEKTINELINEWLNYKKVILKESSYYRYIYMINQYILPYLNNIKMVNIVSYDFNNLVVELMKTLKATSIKNVIGLLKSILSYAYKKYGYEYNFNFVSLPKIHKAELRVLTQREKNRLEKYCLKNNNLRDIGIVICLNTGLRIGEICALKWNCINLEKRVIKVQYTMQRIYDKIEKKSKISIDVPKSENSLRTIPISTKLYSILKPLKKQYKSNCYFLTGSSNNYIEPRNYQNYFKKCIKVCKIKDFHFHQLRHSFSTECINVGMDIKSLSEILGHSDIKITLQKYVHSSFSTKKKYLERL